MTKILIDRETVEDAIYALDRVIKNRLALVQLASVANSLRAALEQEEQETNPWRDAVDRELTALHMVTSDDPRESVHRLIDWHCAVQIDPLVSSAARDLIERGKREALEQLEEGGPVICWMCGAEDGGTSCGSNCGLIVAEQEQEPVFMCGGTVVRLSPEQAAALEQPEPVARVIEDGTPEGSTEWIPRSMCQATIKTGDLLYTHPPREWVGLKEGEIHDLSIIMVKGDKSVNWLLGALEAALKEKNT
jgi:hypothetical protein